MRTCLTKLHEKFSNYINLILITLKAKLPCIRSSFWFSNAAMASMWV